ncbi:MAG: type II toxin-antitoxin system RelE/ParE family toxin [Deltaproteobacteria bacterium]|nr:type II toxin-antitoxin system RelE/ParE family toxin [Deltaproteobacteria bacterium]
MKLPIVFHDLAERELSEAAEYYDSARPGLGRAFISAVERASASLEECPLAGREISLDVRWWLIKRFPYALVYRVRETHVRILAVANTKRRPLYWCRRR